MIIFKSAFSQNTENENWPFFYRVVCLSLHSCFIFVTFFFYFVFYFIKTTNRLNEQLKMSVLIFCDFIYLIFSRHGCPKLFIALLQIFQTYCRRRHPNGNRITSNRTKANRTRVEWICLCYIESIVGYAPKSLDKVNFRPTFHHPRRPYIH